MRIFVVLPVFLIITAVAAYACEASVNCSACNSGSFTVTCRSTGEGTCTDGNCLLNRCALCCWTTNSGGTTRTLCACGQCPGNNCCSSAASSPLLSNTSTQPLDPFDVSEPVKLNTASFLNANLEVASSTYYFSKQQFSGLKLYVKNLSPKPLSQLIVRTRIWVDGEAAPLTKFLTMTIDPKSAAVPPNQAIEVFDNSEASTLKPIRHVEIAAYATAYR